MILHAVHTALLILSLALCYFFCRQRLGDGLHGKRGGGMYIQYGHATLAGTAFSNNSAAEGPDLLSIDAEIVVQP